MYACWMNRKHSLNILMFDHCQKINTPCNNTNNLQIISIDHTNIINFQNKFGYAAIHKLNDVECTQILLECPHTNVNLQEHKVK